MRNSAFLQFLATESRNLAQAGLLRKEPELAAPQGPLISVGGKEYVNFASSDYLGLANHPEVRKAAIAAVDAWGVGLAAPRVGTGTIALHGELERAVAALVGTDDALVFASGYHANTGLFESLFGDRDYLFCDELVRPSLADGIRLCRARVYSYRNQDLEHLEDRLRRSRGARFRVIVTDGVFPISGLVANLPDLYTLAAKYNALVVVDDTHGLGVLGDGGGGTHQLHGLGDRIDVVTGSFGAALGGGAGGFVAGRTEIIAWLRQKSRPYLASTALPPVATAAALACIELVRGEAELRTNLAMNVRVFRDALAEHGLWTAEGDHPAVSVLIRHAVTAQRLTDYLYRSGVFVIGFCHPVVPEGAARIRAQVTVRHSQKDLSRAADAFAEGIRELHIDLARKP
ncbi:MAG TPA: aminotransferase class I/II-fold pyridoxal phosphate-dependent enzyme [Polyangia bacterium]